MDSGILLTYKISAISASGDVLIADFDPKARKLPMLLCSYPS